MDDPKDPDENLTPARAEVTQDERDTMLSESVRRSHGIPTCDPSGRPLSTYTCEYHQGYEDGIDRACDP